jgi:hypothetical protein
LAGLASILPGCGNVSPTSLEQFATSSYGSPETWSFVTEPPMPSTMKVGQRLRIRVWPNGVVNNVEFQSGENVRWVEADPPCPWNACADLEATRATEPGQDDFVVIWICPPEYEGCYVGKPYYIRVLPR